MHVASARSTGSLASLRKGLLVALDGARCWRPCRRGCRLVGVRQVHLVKSPTRRHGLVGHHPQGLLSPDGVLDVGGLVAADAWSEPGVRQVHLGSRPPDGHGLRPSPARPAQPSMARSMLAALSLRMRSVGVRQVIWSAPTRRAWPGGSPAGLLVTPMACSTLAALSPRIRAVSVSGSSGFAHSAGMAWRVLTNRACSESFDGADRGRIATDAVSVERSNRFIWVIRPLVEHGGGSSPSLLVASVNAQCWRPISARIPLRHRPVRLWNAAITLRIGGPND